MGIKDFSLCAILLYVNLVVHNQGNFVPQRTFGNNLGAFYYNCRGQA